MLGIGFDFQRRFHANGNSFWLDFILIGPNCYHIQLQTAMREYKKLIQ